MTHDVLFPAILHGGDYNPEQWPPAVWDDDMRLMQEAHINVATLPVFGWVSLQPAEDEWTWDWLDTILDKMHASGVYACLATATASVPAWLPQKYPDVLRVGADGRRVKHGNRHTFCPNSPDFRRLAANLVRRLAERYAAHPALLVWHVSNGIQPPVLLRRVRAGISRLAAKARHPPGRERRLEHDLLGPHVHGLAPN